MKLSEDEFFMIAISLIEKKQRLLEKSMDNHCVELVQETDALLGKLEQNHPKCAGMIDLIYRCQQHLP